jgi:transposase
MDDIKIDYRKSSSEEVFAVKKTIIKQWKIGKTTAEIQKNTGMCLNTIRATIHDYKIGGLAAIKPKKEGRPTGSCMSLTKEQCNEIQKAIIDKDPDQLKMPFALWTRKAVKELIKAKYGIDMPIRTVGEYLKRWGFTPQRPEKCSRHQDHAAVKRWLDEEYPAIKEQAKNEDDRRKKNSRIARPQFSSRALRRVR